MSSPLYDDANKDETVAALMNFSITVVAQVKLLLDSGTFTAIQIEDLACRVEHLLSTIGHIRRLWPIPQR